MKSDLMKLYPVDVTVATEYLSNQSEPGQKQFVFSYTITIKNNGEEPVQLLSRKWEITDADGKTTEVIGEGVVGKQPTIQPGKAFTYTSGTVLRTPIGHMQGSYGMVNPNGEHWELDIPVFTLAKPNILH